MGCTDIVLSVHCLLRGVDGSLQRARQSDRQHGGVITQNACYINKLRACFQLEPNYMVFAGHREKHRSQGR